MFYRVRSNVKKKWQWCWSDKTHMLYTSQNIHTRLILHTLHETPKQAQQSCLLSESDPCSFSCWRCSLWRAGWGCPGGFSPAPPHSLSMGWWSRPDAIARQVFKYTPGRCAFQQTWNKIQTIMITRTYLFHIQTQTQSWLSQTDARLSATHPRASVKETLTLI